MISSPHVVLTWCDSPTDGGIELHEAAAVAGLRVVEDDLLIHLFEVAHELTPKKVRTVARVSTKSLASSSVVYTWALARVEPDTPKRR